MLLAPLAEAGLSAPIPFAKLSKDESKILVVRDGGDGFSESQITNPKLSNGVEVDFMAVFPRAGVYRLASQELVYEIPWFCLEREVVISDDLEHIARINRFGSNWALKVYDHGIEVSSFTLNQMLTSFTGEQYRPFSTWDYFHPWHEDFELKGGQIQVTTVERELFGFPIHFNEVHTFDFKSGSLTHTTIHNGLFWGAVGGACLVIFLATSLLLARRARCKRDKRKRLPGSD